MSVENQEPVICPEIRLRGYLEEHQLLDDLIDEYQDKEFLTDDEQLKIKQLKKIRLEVKDKIEMLSKAVA